jgi:lipid II:glycine glycyltransferase (peptidoglycan interpeptide bridge formation enzyme)
VSSPDTYSLKYWKVEHDYRYQIHRNTKLTYNYLNNLEEKANFKTELQRFDDSYKVLKNQLKENPSMDNITNMLRFYQEELLILEENIQDYTNKKSQSN